MKTAWMMLAALLVAAAPCFAQTSSPANPDSASAPAPAPTPPPAAVVATPPTPPDFPRGRISGYMFGDVYYNVNGNPNHVYDAAGADIRKHNIDATPAAIGQDLSGAQLRRVYFQLDNDLSIKYATRFRLEVDGKSLTSDGKIGVNVKAAYLLAKSVYTRGDMYFGVVTTPIWENSEEFWGYRSIEKTIADFRGLGSSADLGIEVKGFVDAQHHFGYAALLGNGPGQKPENDRYKKYYLTLPVRFGDLRVEPYVDYEPVQKNVPGNFDKATYKLFAGYEFRKMAVGVEAVDRVNHAAGPGGANQEQRGISVFGRGTVTPTINAFARFDHWIPDNNLDNRVDSQLWIAGFDWQPFRDVHIQPNIEATQYLTVGTPAPALVPANHDVQARITFYYRFSRPQSS